MPSTRAKGRKREIQVKKLIESWGYSVDLTQMPTRWAKQQDFFGEFDLICVKKAKSQSEYSNVLLVQVKSNSTAGALKSIREWKQNHDTTYIQTMVIVVMDNVQNDDKFKIYIV